MSEPRPRLLDDLKLPALVFAVAFCVLALFSWHRFLHQSKAPQFVYQAQAFLDGSLALTAEPPNQEDWVKVGDRFYQSFPVVPALLMLPGVALFGYQFNDTSFTVLMAALGLAMFFALLRALVRAGDLARTSTEALLCTALLGFGTLFFYASIRGEVWFTAETIGVGFTALYVFFSLRARHPALAGVAYALATLTRTPLMFAGVFFLAEVFSPSGTLAVAELKQEAGAKLKKVALFAAGALPLAAFHAWLNWARFGSPGEFGHRLLWNNRVNADIQKWGLFSYQYLERNLHAAFTKLPTLNGRVFGYDPHGLSLLVTMPFLVLLLWPREKPRLHRALWLTVACTALPGLFYQNDGYMQFGFRFSIDYLPYLVLLLALSGWSVKSLRVQLLALAAVAMNVWGALVFRGYSW